MFSTVRDDLYPVYAQHTSVVGRRVERVGSGPRDFDGSVEDVRKVVLIPISRDREIGGHATVHDVRFAEIRHSVVGIDVVVIVLVPPESYSARVRRHGHRVGGPAQVRRFDRHPPRSRGLEGSVECHERYRPPVDESLVGHRLIPAVEPVVHDGVLVDCDRRVLVEIIIGFVAELPGPVLMFGPVPEVTDLATGSCPVDPDRDVGVGRPLCSYRPGRRAGIHAEYPARILRSQPEFDRPRGLLTRCRDDDVPH